MELSQFTAAESLAPNFMVQTHHKPVRRNLRRQTTQKKLNWSANMKYFLPQIILSVDTGFYHILSRISFSSEGTEVTVLVCTFYLLRSPVQMSKNSFF